MARSKVVAIQKDCPATWEEALQQFLWWKQAHGYLRTGRIGAAGDTEGEYPVQILPLYTFNLSSHVHLVMACPSVVQKMGVSLHHALCSSLGSSPKT
jgi:hypothetical protein